jgi:lipopolysaccharide export system protein LptA
MKNNFYSCLILIIIFLGIENRVHSDELIFDTKNIKILNKGDLTIAEDGNAKLIEKNIDFIGDKFLYNRIDQTLEIDNSKILLNNDNISINANKVFYDKNKSLIRAKGNILINHLRYNLKFNTEDLIYDFRLF